MLIERKAELATQEQRLKHPDIDELLIEQREHLESEKDMLQEQANKLNQAVNSANKDEGHLHKERENLISNLEASCQRSVMLKNS